MGPGGKWIERLSGRWSVVPLHGLKEVRLPLGFRHDILAAVLGSFQQHTFRQTHHQIFLGCYRLQLSPASIRTRPSCPAGFPLPAHEALAQIPTSAPPISDPRNPHSRISFQTPSVPKQIASPNFYRNSETFPKPFALNLPRSLPHRQSSNTHSHLLRLLYSQSRGALTAYSNRGQIHRMSAFQNGVYGL